MLVSVRILNRTIRKACTFLTVSFILYIFLTTVIPQLPASFNSHEMTQLNSIPPLLQDKKIQLLIAHPDDEVMFFAPTLIELGREEHRNRISVVCFSNGNDAGLGPVREKEVVRSLEILGIRDVAVLNDETTFKDSMNITWKRNDVLKYVDDDADVLLTFDSHGVSGHPNHKSIYDAVESLDRPTLRLISLGVANKYSSTFVSNYQLLVRYFNRFVNKGSFLISNKWGLSALEGFKAQGDSTKLIIYSDLPSWILGTAAMAFAHHSQMVWFRWGWLVLSRYGNTNELTLHNF